MYGYGTRYHTQAAVVLGPLVKIAVYNVNMAEAGAGQGKLVSVKRVWMSVASTLQSTGQDSRNSSAWSRIKGYAWFLEYIESRDVVRKGLYASIPKWQRKAFSRYRQTDGVNVRN
jgi:hypothetical protein